MPIRNPEPKPVDQSQPEPLANGHQEGLDRQEAAAAGRAAARHMALVVRLGRALICLRQGFSRRTWRR